MTTFKQRSQRQLLNPRPVTPAEVQARKGLLIIITVLVLLAAALVAVVLVAVMVRLGVWIWP